MLHDSDAVNIVCKTSRNDITKKHAWFVCVVCFFVSVCCSRVFATDLAETRYGGKTLGEWKVLVKESSFDELSDPDAVSALIEIINDRDVPDLSRRQMALTLGRIGQPAAQAIPDLARILKNESVDLATVLWVLKSLALFGPIAEDLTTQVANLVTDVDISLLIRMQAIETLGKIGKNRKESIVAFIEVLRRTQGDSAQKELRMVAADGLWLLGEAAAPALPELIRAAQDPWPLARLTAVTSIGQIGPLAEIAVPTLVDIVLFDEEGEVREAAADALGSVGSASLPALKQLLTDQNLEVRRLAIRAVKQLPPGEADQLLLLRLQDQALIAQIEAARMLLLRDNSQVFGIEVLLLGLESEEREARITSYRALQQHPKVLQPHREKLESLAQSEHVQTRKAAEQLLKIQSEYKEHNKQP